MAEAATTVELSAQAKADPADVPLDQIDVSDPSLFEANRHWGFFQRLREEDPVHYQAVPLDRSGR